MCYIMLIYYHRYEVKVKVKVSAKIEAKVKGQRSKPKSKVMIKSGFRVEGTVRYSSIAIINAGLKGQS